LFCGLIQCPIPGPYIVLNIHTAAEMASYRKHWQDKLRSHNSENHWAKLDDLLQLNVLSFIGRPPETIKIFWKEPEIPNAENTYENLWRSVCEDFSLRIKNLRFICPVIDEQNREQCLQNSDQFVNVKIHSVGPCPVQRDLYGNEVIIISLMGNKERFLYPNKSMNIPASHNLERLPNQTLPLLKTILALHHGLQTIIDAYPDYADLYGTPNFTPLLLRIHTQFAEYLRTSNIAHPNLSFAVPRI
jgi:hypothetical protein